MSTPNHSALLRVGIVGTGGIALQHALGWLTFDDRAVISAVVDIDTIRAQAFSNLHTGGTARVFDTLDAMLAGDLVDVVDICLPHHLHTDAVIAAADAGKAILCEKPLCTSLADARRARAAVGTNGVAFMSGHNQLFQPSLIEARRLITHGAIGTPYLIRSIETFQARAFDPFNYDEQPSNGPVGWRTNVRHAGGGELLDTGYHSTYRLLALTNNDRPVEVTGILSRFFLSEWPTEDTGIVLVRFASGAIGEILTSWALDVPGSRQFEVSGSLGSIAGASSWLEQSSYRSWSQSSRMDIPPVPTFTAEIGHFIDIVTANAPNPADIEVATRVLQVIKGAYLSAKLGRTVSLPEAPDADPLADAERSTTPFSADVLDDVLA